MLACAQWQADPSAAARHLPELARAAQAGYLTERRTAAVIQYLLWDGRADDAREVLDSLARNRASAAHQDGGMAVDPGLLRPWLYCFYPDVLHGTQPGQEPGTAQNPPAATLRSQGAALLATAMARAPGDPARDAEQILEGSRLTEATLAPITVALTTLILLDQHEKARSWCKLMIEKTDKNHIRTWQSVFLALYSIVDLRQGNPIAAKKHASTALALISPRGWGVAVALPLGSLLLATTMMGDYEDAGSYLSVHVPEETHRTPFALHYLHGRGKYHLATGNFHAAMSDFRTCGSLMARWQLDLPSLVPWRSGAAEACLGLGREQEARDLTEQQLALLETGSDRIRGISLRVRAAVTDPSSRPTVLREAISHLSRCGDPAELALTFADLSDAHKELGEHRQARVTACRAHYLADRCGIKLRAMLPDLRQREPVVSADVSADVPTGCQPSELSSAELRVAKLAAQGFANRQIADELFITVSTVEQHLTHVYRKLSINRRTDLPVGLEAIRPERIFRDSRASRTDPGVAPDDAPGSQAPSSTVP
jgi:DNA-binding NarL/FixJ family response regulator